MIEEIYKVKVGGWMLVYLPRDNPMDTQIISVKVMDEKRKAEVLHKLKHDIKIHRYMLKAETLAMFKVVQKYKLCTSLVEYKEKFDSEYEDSKCPYAAVCFTKRMDKTIEERFKLGEKQKMWPMIAHAPTDIQEKLNLYKEQQPK